MKKIFTLVAAIMLVSASFAQYGQGGKNGGSNNSSPNNGGYSNGNQNNGGYKNDRDVVYNDNRHYDHHDNHRSLYSFSPREREMTIISINREYDRRASEIRFRAFMSPFRKSVALRQLEQSRQLEIREVWAKFNSPNNVFGDKYGRRH